MTPFHALLLGLLQGLTEFLPIASDGHLALATLLLGDQGVPHDVALFYDVLLHVATMLAVMVRFRAELFGLLAAFGRSAEAHAARRVILLIVLASIPTAVIALSIKDACERAYRVPALVGVGFIGTALLLVAARALVRRRLRAVQDAPLEDAQERVEPWHEGLAKLRFRDAVAIGAAQGVAPWPGLSRSGSTITTALALGVSPETATRFSLLVSLPAIGGAFLLKLSDLEGVPEGLGAMLLGAVVAGVVGYVAIGWLLAVVRRGRLEWFAAYAFLLGVVLIVAGAIRAG